MTNNSCQLQCTLSNLNVPNSPFFKEPLDCASLKCTALYILLAFPVPCVQHFEFCCSGLACSHWYSNEQSATP